MKFHWYTLVLAQIFSLIIGLLALKKGSVSLSGFLAIILFTSLFIWFRELGLLVSLFYMFATSSLWTKIRDRYDTSTRKIKTKTGPRDIFQAFANMGCALLLMLLMQLAPEEYEKLIIVMLLSSIATANSDSWASEIGGLARGTTYHILTGKKMAIGISGGISFVGTIGGLAGSLFISVGGVLTYNALHNEVLGIDTMLIIAIAGFTGMLLDSILGAQFQSLYKKEGELSERNGARSTLVKGISWIDNDVVNLISTFLGAIISGGLFILMH